MLQQALVSVREIVRFVGENNCYTESHPTSRTTLLSPPDANELCSSPELQSGGDTRQIQYNTPVESAQQTRSEMVEDPYNSPMGAPTCSPDPSIIVHSDASNQGWGAVLYGQSHTGGIWSPEEAVYHIN